MRWPWLQMTLCDCSVLPVSVSTARRVVRHVYAAAAASCEVSVTAARSAPSWTATRAAAAGTTWARATSVCTATLHHWRHPVWHIGLRSLPTQVKVHALTTSTKIWTGSQRPKDTAAKVQEPSFSVIPLLLGGIALACRASAFRLFLCISPVPTHFSVAWSVGLSVVCRRSHIYLHWQSVSTP